MKISERDGGFEVTCSRDELIVINNALNNIPQAVSEPEYGSLIGANKTDVDALLAQINSALG